MTRLHPRQQARVVAALIGERPTMSPIVVVAEVEAGLHDAHPAAGASGAGAVPSSDPARYRVRVYLTAAELADLDARRGAASRSDWLASQAGLRSRSP
jgi:hypothetical protein